MQKGAVPAVINHKGRALQKPKLSLATRVANNSQKKIETLNRIDDVSLKTMHRFFELEMIICETGYKKNSFLLKKQISSYQKSLNESKARQKTATRAFITQPPPSPIKTEHQQAALVPEPPPRPKYGVYFNCDPEAIGSVRRKTKAIQASSVSKSLTDLHRLRDKHVAEYKQAVSELEKLRSKVGLPFVFDVSCRSYTPASAAALPYSPIIASLRNKIKYSENELAKLQRRLQEVSNRQFPRSKTAGQTSSVGEEEEVAEAKSKEPTFKIFCDKRDTDVGLGERELSTLTSRPITTDAAPLLAKRRNSRRNSRAVRLDLEKLKSESSVSQPFLNMLINNSKNNYIDVVDNPFDSGEIPPQTRSRLLIEAKNDDTMYRWLGFKTKAGLEKALKENPRSIKQLPTALLALVEDDEEQEDLDKQEFSDSESEKEDDDDARFKIFDKKKFKNRRESVMLGKG